MPRKKTKLTTANTRTLDEKIASTEALLAKYKQQKLAESIVNDLQVGDDVSFVYGRGDKRRNLSGTVTATGQDESLGLMAAITTGSGLDVQVLKVRAVDITENRTADSRKDAPAPDAGAEVDPLSAA